MTMSKRDYDYERGFAIANARGALFTTADEFGQVYADVLAAQGHSPADAWRIWSNQG